ncbi:hypothetical protein DRE_04333 [Drechslerella stenobrocha 248]|uniref:Uncharacterized protein n=1 Tax=Drechslerella stenobrocha 248 TaxID=1043628 RepID=W7IBB4_9PEZI|nr:hypothetical protein DRE_04333 [Drechslerella stenobrocha 248]
MPPSRTKTLNYTVEVVDKTGKAIHTSRTILGALREARDAYKAKRAERKAERDAEKAARRAVKERAYEEQLREARHARREARRAIEDGGRAEDRRRERRERHERRMIEAGGVAGVAGAVGAVGAAEMLTRDNGSDTSSLYSAADANRSTGQLTVRSMTDLSLPPPPPEVDEEEDHLTALFTQVQDIIDHAAAAQSSVITLVEALRRDPETLAMVGITLAEISTIIAKMSPAALAGVKLSWPMVFTFLASPQFAIVAGVGIGTTIILLGGYKIIKKMIYGEPAKPPEIVDMGGKVVEEGEVRVLTQGDEPVREMTQRIEEIRIDEPVRERERERERDRERERERHHRSKKDPENDPLAFGHSEGSSKRRNSNRDVGSRRSSEDPVRPTQHRSNTAPVGFMKRSNTLFAAKTQQPEVPQLAFDVSKSSSKSRSSHEHRSSKSSKSDDSKKSSSKRDRDTKDLEEGGKYLVVRRRK